MRLGMFLRSLRHRGPRPVARRARPTVEGMEPRNLLAVSLPSGFTASVVSRTGLVLPTSMDIASDGRVFVSEQWGAVKVIKDGKLLDQPVMQLSVNSDGENGLSHIVLDPNFTRNGYLYAYYTTKGNPHNRVSRFTIRHNKVVPGSERVLLEIPPRAAGVPPSHNGGALHFGKDGKLYIAVGDHKTSGAAQRLNSLYGKVLRINRDGSIPRDNPFYRWTRGSNRAIFALGFRNPFTFAVQPGTGILYVNDVGEAAWEEVNRVVRGGNYGWPRVEGPAKRRPYRDPFYAYPHTAQGKFSIDETGCAVIGGTFTAARGRWPSQYRSAYFTTDYCSGQIRQVNPRTGRMSMFATGLPEHSVDLDVAPDGTMYYLAREDMNGALGGILMEIKYATHAAPSIVTGPTAGRLAAGASATFEVSAAGSGPFQYQWYRDGVPIEGATGETYTTPVLDLPDDGARFWVTVTNAFGQATSDPATVQITLSQPPTAIILSPQAGQSWDLGRVIHVRGTATDPEQGELPGSAFTWWVDLVHDTHVHPFIAPSSVTGFKAWDFTIPKVKHDSGLITYRIYLKVTDDSGLSSVTFHDLEYKRFT
jgi:glucose/arabinose dehydrogenase